MKRTLSLTLACLTAAVSAQQVPQPSNAGAQIATKSSASAAIFRVPIHTQAADPDGGEYGIWASGDTYKVSFHDGMTFSPAIADVDGQVNWKTTSVRIGERELLNAETSVQNYSDWRYEYNHGEVIEAYDVRVEGVEQTFVFRTIPGHGDLVVTGRIDSPLSMQSMAPKHGSVMFQDSDGRSLVEYGAATVIDAMGRRLEITTGVDGQDIELRVPAAWLANATAPVTIDPLLSRTSVRSSLGHTISVEIARDDESNQVLIGYVRWMGSESDLFVVLCNDDYSGSTLVYSDVTASWKTHDPSFAFVGGGDKWVMSFTRKFSFSSYAIRYRFHQKGLKQALFTYKVLPGPGGLSTTHSDVGGTAAFTSGTKALLVFEADTFPNGLGSDQTDVWGVILNSATETASSAFLLSTLGSSAASNRDRGIPVVNQESDGGTTNWVVAWNEYNKSIIGDDWDIYVAQVSTSGTPSGALTMATPAKARNSTRPRIAGRSGRYLLAFGDVDNSNPAKGEPAGAQNLYAQRFDWSDGAQFAVRKTPRPVRTNGTVTYFLGEVAYDHNNRSHWVMVSHGMSPNQVVWADVIGYAGGIVESLQVSSVANNSDFSPAVVFNDDADQFAIVHGSLDDKVYGRMLTRNATSATTYGFACGPGSIQGVGSPQSGSEFFKVRLSGAAPNTNAFLSLALAPAAINLSFIGMTGCFSNTDPNLFLTTIPIVTGATNGEVQLPMPAPISADVYVQFIYMNAGANALGVQATKGLKLEIR